MALWRKKVTGIETERSLRPVLVISAILIAGILTKLDAAWLGIIIAAMLCVLLATRRPRESASACTHLVRRIDSGARLRIPGSAIRVISMAALRVGWSAAMLSRVDWTLGRFGDRRLDKGGRRLSDAWSRARMSACGGSPRGIVRWKCGSIAFWATTR